MCFNMRKKVTMTASLLLLATQFCHARALTLAEADAIIVILLFVVIVLLVLGGISLHYNRVVSRRTMLSNSHSASRRQTI